MSASREDHRLGPGHVPAAPLPEQQQYVTETGTMSGCPASDPGSPPGLPGPLPVPVHLHVHAAGPGSSAPALSPCPEVVTRVHRAVVNK